MRVYAVLVDIKTGRVGLNQKDSLLPDDVKQYEGLISLFGGGAEVGEKPLEVLVRELAEEIPGFVGSAEIDQAMQVHSDEKIVVYAVPTDLSGQQSTREDDRVGRPSRICLEGEGIVRTIEFVRRAPEAFFIIPALKQIIIDAYEAIETAKPQG